MGQKYIVAIDDGYFPHRYKSLKGSAPIVGVLGYREVILDIAIGYTLVDCRNITRTLSEISERLIDRDPSRIKAVVTHSVIMSGFSVFEPDDLYRRLGKPIIVFFDHDLSLDRIRLALEKNFSDHEYRYRVIEINYSKSVKIVTRNGKVRIRCVGADLEWCIDIVISNQTTHPMPQPLRHADLVASGVGRFLAENSTAPSNIICEP
jgi:endonuclease V-like protein UPF0215 family